MVEKLAAMIHMYRPLTLGAHAQRGLRYLSCMSVCQSVCLPVCLSVCLSACYHVFCLYAQQGNKIAIRGGLLLQQLNFKKGNFCKTAAFKSYGPKTKRTSYYSANMQISNGLPGPQSIRWRHQKSQQRAGIKSRND